MFSVTFAPWLRGGAAKLHLFPGTPLTHAKKSRLTPVLPPEGRIVLLRGGGVGEMTEFSYLCRGILRRNPAPALPAPSNMSQPKPPYISPYRRGADDGFRFAIYLTVMFFASIYAAKVAMLSLAVIGLMLGVPFVIYHFLRRAYVEEHGTTLMSALWMHGIMIFLCGSLLAGAVEFVWLRWIDPTYIIDQLHAVIELYEDSGWDRGEEIASLLREMIDRKMVPTAISIVMEMIWLSVFTGSLLSALMALLVRARPLPPSNPSSQFN